MGERLLSTLLNEMDGFVALEGVIVIGCTTRKDAIDEALIRPGRIDYVIEIPLPTALDRHAMFSYELKRLSYEFTEETIQEMVEATEGYTCADVKSLLNSDARDQIDNPLPLSTASILDYLRRKGDKL